MSTANGNERKNMRNTCAPFPSANTTAVVNFSRVDAECRLPNTYITIHSMRVYSCYVVLSSQRYTKQMCRRRGCVVELSLPYETAGRHKWDKRNGIPAPAKCTNCRWQSALAKWTRQGKYADKSVQCFMFTTHKNQETHLSSRAIWVCWKWYESNLKKSQRTYLLYSMKTYTRVLKTNCWNILYSRIKCLFMHSKTRACNMYE